LKSVRPVFALVLIIAVALLPTSFALPFGNVTVAVAGPGTVYWKGVFNGVLYNSGSVNNSSSITLPQGTMVTFTPEPLTGHHFTNWVVNGYGQGSETPFVSFTGASGVVIANFDGTLVENPDGTYANANPVPILAAVTTTLRYSSVRINVRGSGTVFWSASYESSSESGSTSVGYSILVPYGGTVTFTATPSKGNGFGGWNVNSASVVSINPYTINNTYTNPATTTLTAIFFTPE